MLNRIHINPFGQKLIIYIILTVITLSVYLQVNQFDFINLDDRVYITKNYHITSGISLEGFRWAFSTTYANDFWYPMMWLSFMLDYQLHGLNAGGYHLTNLILHILSTLLLFWLFNHMTGAIWKSAFVAAVFALHPLHVESVAWISERKGVLSGFFWMLTLCLYVHYTEKPIIKRYLFVFCSFVLALMSKPMVVTLPAVMILLDYWPLKRFESHKSNILLWQMKEKLPFFILSAAIVIITLFAQSAPAEKAFPLITRLVNAPVFFITHLEKTFWPQNLALGYNCLGSFPIGNTLGATALIVIISTAVILMARRLPYLFVGWLWYAATIAPIVGIIHIGPHLMADRFHYLPSIGISIMLAWGIPLLFYHEDTRRIILPQLTVAFLIILSVLTWKQCGYWKNSFTLFNHALQVTYDNYLAHSCFGSALLDEEKAEEAITHFKKSIHIKPDYAFAYNNRGISYSKIGEHQSAIEDFNKAINLKKDYANAYINRGTLYGELGTYKLAFEDLNKAISLNPYRADAYFNRAFIYFKQNDKFSMCNDAQKACELKNCELLERAQRAGYCK